MEPDYDWSGRSIERHRAQIREALGFREPTRADEDTLVEWLWWPLVSPL